MADELAPKPVPQPAPGPGNVPPAQLPGEGRHPIPTGRVIMSDYTRKQLQAAGWKDGDPVPGDLGTRLQEIQNEAVKDRATANYTGEAIADGWEPVKTDFVDIESLPLEKQQEVRAYLQAHKTHVAEQESVDAHVATVDAQIPPTVQGPDRDLMRNQILHSEAVAAARYTAGESVVIDDRPQAAVPPPDVVIPEGKKYGGALGVPSVAEKIEIAAAQQREAEQPPPPEVEEPELPTAGAAAAPQHCARCTWPVAMPFELEITAQDKQGFMASAIGITRFEKKVEMLQGKMAIYFRSLTTNEIKLLNLQLSHMIRNGEIIGDGEYWEHLMELRMVLAVSRIESAGNVIYTSPSLEQWEQENKVNQTTSETAPTAANPTALPRMKDYFYANGVTQSPMRKIIGRSHRAFQQLVEALEAMVDEPGFWEGIELPA